MPRKTKSEKKSKKSPRSRAGGRGHISVNFKGVEVGQRGVHIPEGDYRVRVESVEQKDSEASGQPFLNFKLVLKKGEFKGKTLYHICSLQSQALFNLRTTLLALGMEVPQKRISIKPASLTGKEMMVTVQDDEYQGKIRSRVVDTFPVGGKPFGTEEEEEDEEEEEEDEEEEEEEEEEELDDL